MAQTSMLHVRVDDDVKVQATEALASMGLSVSDAVRLFLETRAGGHIGAHPDDGFDPLFFRGFVKLNDPVQCPVIRQGNSIIAFGLCGFNHFVHVAHGVGQRIHGVDVQMHERRTDNILSSIRHKFVSR